MIQWHIENNHAGGGVQLQKRFKRPLTSHLGTPLMWFNC